MKLPAVLVGAILALMLAVLPAHADSESQIESKFCTDMLQKADPVKWSVFLGVIQNKVLVPHRTQTMTSFATAHLATAVSGSMSRILLPHCRPRESGDPERSIEISGFPLARE